MGYIKHDAIILTAWDEERMAKIHAKAQETGLPVSEIVKSPVNGYRSFFIAPDGSKEGWDASDEGDRRRETFKHWLRANPELYCEWVQVSYSSDSNKALIADESNKMGHIDVETVAPRQLPAPKN